MSFSGNGNWRVSTISARCKSELDAAQKALEDRKTIDRAKGILMRQRGLSRKDTAYNLLRKPDEPEPQSLRCRPCPCHGRGAVVVSQNRLEWRLLYRWWIAPRW